MRGTVCWLPSWQGPVITAFDVISIGVDNIEVRAQHQSDGCKTTCFEIDRGNGADSTTTNDKDGFLVFRHDADSRCVVLIV